MKPTARSSQRNTSYRRDVLWSAALLHRISGVALSLFLPMHFLVLGLAIESEAKLHDFLTWTKMPVVKFAEALLVTLLALHLVGGIRVLMIESRGWRPGQRSMAVGGIVIATFVGVAFLIGT